MATDYLILTPPTEGPFVTIVTSGGEPVAFQVPHKWSQCIILALKVLDAHEKDSNVASYVEQIKRELGR
jgi:hypothetical protein